MPRYKPVEKNKYLALYKRGLSDREIGAIVGTNGWNITHWRRKFNLPANLPLRADRSQISRLYEQGYTDKRIAEILGFSTTWAVSNWRKSKGLPANTRYERAFHPD